MPDAPPHPAAAAATSWHLAGSLVSLLQAVNAHWPKRDKTSDGGIGDARHQAESTGSDHNPWLNNTVRAYDFDKDGIDAGWLAEQLRQLGATGDPRLAGGGYVIWDHHITAPDFSHWVAYTGADPHTSHVHVSVSRNPAGYEYAGPWQFLAAAPIHPPASTPAGKHDATGHGDDYRAHFGDQGPEVAALQEGLKEYAPAYAGDLVVDGVYGEQTAAAVAEFDHREAVDPVTPPPRGDVDGLKHSDGRDVGPRAARAFHRDNIRL